MIIPTESGDRRRRTVLPRHHQGGFTIIEVMVATAVILLGFLGLASLQILALRSADSALERAQATELAYGIIDRMRLNRGTRDETWTALGGGYDGITLCNGSDRHAEDNRQCTHTEVASLTATDNVTTDLRQWWQAIDSADLPHWYAGIQQDDDIFLVSVQWDDERAAIDAQDGTPRSSCLGEDMPDTMEEICVTTQL